MVVLNIIKGWYYRITGKHSDLYKKRYAICKDCEHLVKLSKKIEICSACGCELSAKCRVESEKCLMKKW